MSCLVVGERALVYPLDKNCEYAIITHSCTLKYLYLFSLFRARFSVSAGNDKKQKREIVETKKKEKKKEKKMESNVASSISKEKKMKVNVALGISIVALVAVVILAFAVGDLGMEMTAFSRRIGAGEKVRHQEAMNDPVARVVVQRDGYFRAETVTEGWIEKPSQFGSAQLMALVDLLWRVEDPPARTEYNHNAASPPVVRPEQLPLQHSGDSHNHQNHGSVQSQSQMVPVPRHRLPASPHQPVFPRQ